MPTQAKTQRNAPATPRPEPWQSARPASQIRHAEGGDAIAERLSALEEEVRSLRSQVAAQAPADVVSIVCFSGEWDRLFAALVMASGALAMGQEVHLFFTFWAASVLREDTSQDKKGRSMAQAMLGRVLPKRVGETRLSRLNFFGLGKRMMRRVMKRQGVDDIEQILSDVRELGGHFHLCETTADLFGMSCATSETDPVDSCGVATFMSYALKSKMVLFV